MNIKRDFKINRKAITATAGSHELARIKVPFGQTFIVDAHLRLAADDGASVYEHGYSRFSTAVKNGLGAIRGGQTLTVLKAGTGYTASPIGIQATTAVSPSRGTGLELITTVDGAGAVLTATEGNSSGGTYAPGDIVTLDGGTAQVLIEEADIDSIEALALVTNGGGNDNWGTLNRSMVGTIDYVFSHTIDQSTKELVITVNTAAIFASHGAVPVIVEGGYQVEYMQNVPV